MSDWGWKLVRSSDMSVLEPLSYARARSFDPFWNRPGRAACQIPIDSDGALLVEKHSTALLLELDGEPIWSGPIFGIQDSVPDDKTSLTALGWFEELNHRFVRFDNEPNLIFPSPGAIGGEIAFAILDAINRQTDSSGVIASTHLRAGVNNDTQTRIRSYKAGQNAGASIMELSDIENGIDIKVHPYTRVMNIYGPDVASGAWQVREGVHLGYNVPPNNVARMDHTEDGAQTANRVTGQGPFGTVYADSPAKIQKHTTMLERWESLGDVSSSTIAAAYVNSELEFYKDGAITLTISMRGSDLGQPFVPFRDFNIGDQIFVSADRGRLQLRRQPVRVFGFSVVIDDEGVGSIGDLTVTYSS